MHPMKISMNSMHRISIMASSRGGGHPHRNASYEGELQNPSLVG